MFNSKKELIISAAFLIASSMLSGCLDTGDDAAPTSGNPPTTTPPPPPPPPPPPGNSAPTISGVPTTTATVGARWAFTPNSSDADNDTLTFSISNMPTWASFDSGDGTLSGTPTASHVGEYPDIVLSVSDGEATASLPSFTMTVEGAGSGNNRPPQISGSASESVVVGVAYSFRPTATDPDGDSLAFSVANKPAWLSFNRNTGRLSGTPDVDDVGIHGDVRISVSDGALSDALPAFSITVDNVPNRSPEISGDPAAMATTDSEYQFTPAASDPDGDDLTFSIEGMPAWAAFDDLDGTLSGTPRVEHVGTYNDITISVSDGEFTAALDAFSIEVTQTANGSVRLTWTPPTENSDGSALTDLRAYKFYYGLSENDMPNVVRVDNPGLSSYVIDNLPPNTYYFVTTVVNSEEVESDFSNVASFDLTGN